MTAAPIHAVVDGIPAVLPELSVDLSDGRTGYYQRSPAECLKAAVATATQVPYDELPDIGSLRELHAWADREGFTVQMHFPPDLPVTAPQWIGVSPMLPGYEARHTNRRHQGDPEGHVSVRCDHGPAQGTEGEAVGVSPDVSRTEPIQAN